MLVMLSSLAACKAEPPGAQMAGGGGASGAPATGATGAMPAGPTAPTVSTAELTSLTTAALRGSSPGATQVVVQTSQATSLVVPLLPDGSFCIDVPLQAGQANPFDVFAVGGGKMSAAAHVTVVQAPGGPTPAKGTCMVNAAPAPICSGDNAVCDPRCNGCAEDVYQPNFGPGQAPAIALKQSYAGLQLCPCRADWFTFVLYKGQHITLTATYQKTADFDLDLSLFAGGDVLPQPSGKPAVATGTAGTSSAGATRTLDFTATSGGSYYLQIGATTDSKARGAYSLVTQSK